jgi:hypothetical protein
MTKRVAAALLFLFAVALPLHADFASIARAIDAQHGVNRVWIPFLSIARVAVRLVEPEGVHDFSSPFEGTENADPRAHRILRAKVGAGVRALVQGGRRESTVELHLRAAVGRPTGWSW